MSSLKRRREAPRRPIRKPRYLSIDFACNGDGGHFEGHVMGAAFLGLTLENFDEPAFTVDHDRRVVRIHRKTFPFIAWKEWVGNWCWNSYRFERKVARDLLRTLRRNGGWTADSGPVRITTWWESL